ncbi:MAG: NAD(P)-dependent oxidoreductase [Pseudomonadota bacterium]
MGRVLVTPRSLSKDGHPALADLEEAGYTLVMAAPGKTPSEADLIAALPGCEGWLAGVEPVSERALETADRLRIISRNGTGVDNLPLGTLRKRQIKVTRTVGTNSRSVAELALAFIMAGLRQVVWTHTEMVDGAWPRRMGREISGATIGIVGLGGIGSELAKMCLALGANVRAHDPFAPQDRLVQESFARVSLEDALAPVDAVSLHMPMHDDGSPVITADVLSLFAPQTVLVNTARAGLVDEAALLTALGTNQVAAYLVDVFDIEPPPPSLLLEHPKVVRTSHIGGFTTAAVDRTTELAVRNLLVGLEASS